jgi:glycosyltransferase involved in cell wall biosynthesis
MKLCFVVQRAGEEVTGGAEMHCRWLARRLARRHQVELVSTCALDYRTWTDHYPAGRAHLDGLPVTRFPVARPRDARRFALYSDIVFRDFHTPADESVWLEENGPLSPALVQALPARGDVDLFIFYSYRYYTTCLGLPPVASRAVLVPTAEDDEALRLACFRELFARPRAFLYLTPEERESVQAAGARADAPSAVIGSGVDLRPDSVRPEARARFDLPERYAVYVGRIEAAKGVETLVDYWVRLASEWPDLPLLALAGQAAIELPRHPRVRALSVVSDDEKAALIAGAELLLLPSALESLSISVLEAWALGRPVLVNAACRVLEGQCRRSNGGLFYRGLAEFAPALRLLLDDRELRRGLGLNGQDYVRREYAWDVVESRAEALLTSLGGAASSDPSQRPN